MKGGAQAHVALPVPPPVEAPSGQAEQPTLAPAPSESSPLLLKKFASHGLTHEPTLEALKSALHWQALAAGAQVKCAREHVQAELPAGAVEPATHALHEPGPPLNVAVDTPPVAEK